MTIKSSFRLFQNVGAEKARKAQKVQEAVLAASPLDVSSIEKGSFFEDDDVLSFGELDLP